MNQNRPIRACSRGSKFWMGGKKREQKKNFQFFFAKTLNKISHYISMRDAKGFEIKRIINLDWKGKVGGSTWAAAFPMKRFFASIFLRIS